MGNGNNYASVLEMEKRRREAAKQAAKATDPAPEAPSVQGAVGNQEVGRVLRDRVAGEGKEGDAKQKEGEGEEPANSFTKTSGFELKAGKPPKNKAGFEAEVEIPVSGPNVGAFKFLTPPKLKAEGSRESEQPISLGAIELQSLKIEATQTIVKLEVDRAISRFAKWKLKSELGGSASVTRGFGPGAKNQESAGSDASLKGGLYLSPITSFGKFKLDTTLGLKTSAERVFGDEPEQSLKATGDVGVKAAFESRPLRRLSGPLTKDVRLTAGSDVSYSATHEDKQDLKKPVPGSAGPEPSKTPDWQQKLHAGGELGIQGKYKNATISLKLQGGLEVDPVSKAVDYKVNIPLAITF